MEISVLYMVRILSSRYPKPVLGAFEQNGYQAVYFDFPCDFKTPIFILYHHRALQCLNRHGGGPLDQSD